MIRFKANISDPMQCTSSLLVLVVFKTSIFMPTFFSIRCIVCKEILKIYSKDVIRSRKSKKYRQYSQKKKDKRTINYLNTTPQKTKY